MIRLATSMCWRNRQVKCWAACRRNSASTPSLGRVIRSFALKGVTAGRAAHLVANLLHQTNL
jgi:hypothetical protein